MGSTVGAEQGRGAVSKADSHVKRPQALKVLQVIDRKMVVWRVRSLGLTEVAGSGKPQKDLRWEEPWSFVPCG